MAANGYGQYTPTGFQNLTRNLPESGPSSTGAVGTPNDTLGSRIIQNWFFTAVTASPTGTIAATADATTSAITGAFGPSGTIAITTAGSTSAITANFGPSGTIAANSANTTSAVTANFGPSGTIAATTADTTSSIAGSFTASGATGTIAASTADTTSSITGTFAISGASGTIAAQTDPTTSALTGAFGPSGTITGTPQDTTSALSGVVANPVSGTIAATTQDTTLSASGIGGVVVDDDQGSHGATASPMPVPYRPGPKKPDLWERMGRPESVAHVKGYTFARTEDCGFTSAGVFDNTPNERRALEDELLLVLV